MITGRVDDLRQGRIFGWAFNPDDPTERLEIRIMSGDHVAATGLADQFRHDLPEAGVGDGNHAFRIPVPSTLSSLQGLTIIAKSASGAERSLSPFDENERKLDELFAGFSQGYDEILTRLRAEIDEVRAGGRDRASLDDIELRLGKVEKRLEHLEIFVMRLDEMGRTLQERVGLTKPKGLLSWLRRKG